MLLTAQLLRSPQMSCRDVLAVSVVPVAMGAREADLHTAMYGISILKARFYLDAPLHQVLGALCVLAPVAAAAAWLLYRYARCWLRPWSQWSMATTTTAMLVAIAVVAKMLDRAPVVLGLVSDAPAPLLHVMLASEEMLELSLPMFALLAAAQSSLGARASLSDRSLTPHDVQRIALWSPDAYATGVYIHSPTPITEPGAPAENKT